MSKNAAGPPVRPRPGVRSLVRRAVDLARRKVLFRYRLILILLVVLAVGVGLGAVYISPWWFPPSAVIPTVLAGGLLLRRKSLAFLLAAVAGVLSYISLSYDVAQVGPGLLLTIGVTAILAYLLSGVRERLGVRGLRGEQMLLDLRDRLRTQGRLPDLPEDWQTNAVLEQAGGSSFGGDFVVSARHDSRLELAVVDVSGKGVEAGTRSLLLSGAFGGLIGSVPSGGFLAHCNDYLLRTSVGEGFVTAVHLSLDLETGDYRIASAGHPPALHFDAGKGRWRVSEAKGLVLGVMPDVAYAPAGGQLRSGDALMLYTDGLIERPGEDLDAGVDRLLGAAEEVVPQGSRRGARHIVDTLGRDNDDDCALVVIRRA